MFSKLTLLFNLFKMIINNILVKEEFLTIVLFFKFFWFWSKNKSYLIPNNILMTQLLLLMYIIILHKIAYFTIKSFIFSTFYDYRKPLCSNGYLFSFFFFQELFLLVNQRDNIFDSVFLGSYERWENKTFMVL